MYVVMLGPVYSIRCIPILYGLFDNKPEAIAWADDVITGDKDYKVIKILPKTLNR